jgi:hypothetical protein
VEPVSGWAGGVADGGRFSTRPYVAGELLSKGTGLPLFVRPYKGDV